MFFDVHFVPTSGWCGVAGSACKVVAYNLQYDDFVLARGEYDLHYGLGKIIGWVLEIPIILLPFGYTPALFGKKMPMTDGGT